MKRLYVVAVITQDRRDKQNRISLVWLTAENHVEAETKAELHIRRTIPNEPFVASAVSPSPSWLHVDIIETDDGDPIEKGLYLN